MPLESTVVRIWKLDSLNLLRKLARPHKVDSWHNPTSACFFLFGKLLLSYNEFMYFQRIQEVYDSV